jgi:hypothetical protein
MSKRSAYYGLAKSGVSCFYDSDVLNQTFAFRMNFNAKNQPFAKLQNVMRHAWRQCYFETDCKKLPLTNYKLKLPGKPKTDQSKQETESD